MMNRPDADKRRDIACMLFCSMAAICLTCGAQVQTIQIHQDFASDPGWQGVNNSPALSSGVTKVQDFGYSATRHASEAAGELGGQISRSLIPASYLKPISVRTLDDPLTASGRFSVTQSTGGSGMLFGWFNHASRGWRTPNSLAFRIDGDSGKFRVFFEYGTQHWKTGGGETFEGPYQTTKTPMYRADGTPHAWSLAYDPSGAGGLGEIAFVLDGVTYRAALAEGHKQDGAVFDRFGLLNQQTDGEDMTIYLGDISVNGERQDLSTDPGWEAIGNRTTFRDTAIRPLHDFGYRNTSFAGGAPGELGGRVWRLESVNPEQAFCYGTPVGRLSLKEPLSASGKIVLRAVAVDSALLLGWFNSHTAIGGPPANFAGVLIEGPSRVGHYFRPVCSASTGANQIMDSGPVLFPDEKPRTWRITYDPKGTDGNGILTAQLDAESVSLELTPQILKDNAAFDRFGCLSWQRGGHFVDLCLDDIEYTAQQTASTLLSSSATIGAGSASTLRLVADCGRRNGSGLKPPRSGSLE